MTQANRSASFKARTGACVSCLLMATCVQITQAGDSQSAYVMTVIADQAEGERMISGEYAQVIAAITSPKQKERNSFAVSNNLCVAYTKINELSKAGQACADALEVSRTMFGLWYDTYRKRGDQAQALSNRGVVQAISGDADGARSDFEQAVKLNGSLTAAAGNLARLERQATETVSSL